MDQPSTSTATSQAAKSSNEQQVTVKNTTSNNQEDQVCDSWEQLLESGSIERRLNSIKTENDEEKALKSSEMITTMNNKVAPAAKPQQSYEPKKILKRPTSTNNMNQQNALTQQQIQANSIANQQQQKTFEEREKAYAEARLRILGSAHPDDDYKNRANSQEQSNPGSSTYPVKSPNGGQMSSSGSQNRLASNPPPLYNIPYSNSNQNQMNYPPYMKTNQGKQQQQYRTPYNANNNSNNVIREPMGPDGTRGFYNNSANAHSNRGFPQYPN